MSSELPETLHLPSALIGFEPSDHVARVHTWLEDFERDPAFDGLLLLSDKHEAKGSFADLFHQLVIADYAADMFRMRSSVRVDASGVDSSPGCRVVHESPRNLPSSTCENHAV